MSLTIQKDRVATIHYVLRDDEGEIIDASERDEPLPYLHGHDNIVPGLKVALEGKAKGETISVIVPPEEGYGEVTSDELQAMPKEAFPDDIEPGDQLEFEDEEGDSIPIWVVEIQDDVVHVDVDHPLAGVNLHFEVEVLDVREATAQELEDGYPAGEGDDEDDDAE